MAGRPGSPARSSPTRSRPTRSRTPTTRTSTSPGAQAAEATAEPWHAIALTDDSLVNAKHQLAEAIEGLVDVLRSTDIRESIPATDRDNLAKYLTITKLKLENAIALVRSDDSSY